MRGWRYFAPTTPVVARSRKGQVVIDLRTVAPHEDGIVAAALRSIGAKISPGG